MDEKGGITTVVDEEIGTITIGPGQGLFSAPPVLLESLSLPGEDSGGVAGHSSGSVILGGEDVAGAPSDLSTQSCEGFDEGSGLDGHVEGASDLGALERLGGAEFAAASHQAGHLGLSKFNLQATEIGLGHVLDLVL